MRYIIPNKITLIAMNRSFVAKMQNVHIKFGNPTRDMSTFQRIIIKRFKNEKYYTHLPASNIFLITVTMS